MRLSFAFAAALAGAAAADVVPAPPENPIPEACRPLIGVWQQQEPSISRGGQRWLTLAIDSEGAQLMSFLNESGVVWTAATIAFPSISCEPGEGTIDVTLDQAEVERTFAFARVNDDTLTTSEEEAYLQPGPPDPTWTPKTLTKTWKRVAK